MGDIVKSGYMKRYSKSILSGGWKKSFLQLHRNSTIKVYKKQGDDECEGTVFMKDVCRHFAYGEYTAGMPNRPEPPAGASYDQVMGIPQKPNKKAKILWFLFSSSAELHEWLKAICDVLPPPVPQEQHVQQVTQNVSSAPPYSSYGPPQPQYPAANQPPQYPSANQPPVLGFENLSLSGPPPVYPQQPQYPPPPGPGYYPPPPQGYYPPAQPQAAPYRPPPPQGAYPQQAYYPAPAGPPPGVHHGAPQQVYGYQQPTTVVYQDRRSGSKGFPGGNTGKVVAGVAGGALLGYGASRMMGGGWGMGGWGSWSSLSSFGSCGSFGSFGSFD